MIRSWLDLRVAARCEEALDIVGVTLMDPQGRELPPFSAGAHIDVELGDGLVRQYSLCNRLHDHDRYEIAVLRDPASRGGSVAVHALQVGQPVRVSEPRNHFPLAAGATRSILLAGGIGITPLLCMAERLSHTAEPFALHYCTRNGERTAFRERIAASSYSQAVSFHHDDGEDAQRFDARTVLAGPTPGAHLYVCGPTGFIDHVLEEAKAAGWPDSQVHREYFTAAPQDDTLENGAFELRLASTGQTILVGPDVSAAQALEAAGIEIPLSCEQGVCGTCVTRVLEGEPDHRDLFLTDAEHAANDQFTPCCSRALGRLLVIDL